MRLSICFNDIISSGIRRGVLIREADNLGTLPVDITPKDYSVRTLAQEYGGGAFTVSENTVVFSNYKDQRLYLQSMEFAGNLLGSLTTWFLVINF